MTTKAAEQALLTLISLEQKARQAGSIEQLRFIILNQTKSLCAYEQAILWDAHKEEISAASGLVQIDTSAPLTQWLQRLSRQVGGSDKARSVHMPDSTCWADTDKAILAEHFPAVLIWVPLLDREQRLLGALWLARTRMLSIRDKHLLEFWAQSYAHAWQALTNKSRQRWLSRGKKRRITLGILALTAGALCLPVRESVLAPAEVVSANIQVVRMPADGVVSELNIKPDSAVHKGQVLLRLDAQHLNEELAQARARLAIADAELRLARQQSFYDASRKASIAALAGRQQLARSQVTYLKQQVARTQVAAAQAGIALFEDNGDWIGRPLRLGEPVMAIADPTRIKLKIHLAVGDMLTLTPGAKVRFFLNSAPSEPLNATLTNIAYRASLQDNGKYAYVLNADLTAAQAKPQMGLKGVAKLYGEPTTLFYYLLRRPLSQLRLWWGGL